MDRKGLCALLIFILTAPLWASPPHSSVAVIQDPDGYANGREGPGLKFPVKRRVLRGEHVLVTAWPYPSHRPALTSAPWQKALRKLGCDGKQMFDWRWVITMDRDPALPIPANNWAYLHKSRMVGVRDDAVGWGYCVDPDGYTNVRARADSSAPIVARVNLTECFIILDQPAYADSSHMGAVTLQTSPWTKVITRDGIVGFMHTSRIRAHDGREWQWSGEIPFVEVPFDR